MADIRKIKEWNKVDGLPILIYDWDTDSTIKIAPGDHGMGDHFFIFTTITMEFFPGTNIAKRVLKTKRKYLTKEQVFENREHYQTKEGGHFYAQGFQKTEGAMNYDLDKSHF